MRRRILQVFHFAIVSGLGLGLDFLIFILLLSGAAEPFTANLISGASAVTFVYFASVRRIFAYSGRFLLALFLLYLLYQCVGVTAASWAVAALADHTNPLVAKLLVLPITFTANYLFMSFLTRKAGRARETLLPPGPEADRIA
jgi:putative flippase GtrA